MQTIGHNVVALDIPKTPRPLEIAECSLGGLSRGEKVAQAVEREEFADTTVVCSARKSHNITFALENLAGNKLPERGGRKDGKHMRRSVWGGVAIVEAYMIALVDPIPE